MEVLNDFSMNNFSGFCFTTSTPPAIFAFPILTLLFSTILANYLMGWKIILFIAFFLRNLDSMCLYWVLFSTISLFRLFYIFLFFLIWILSFWFIWFIWNILYFCRKRILFHSCRFLNMIWGLLFLFFLWRKKWKKWFLFFRLVLS